MININKIKEIRKILEEELSNNLKFKDDDVISKFQYSKLCHLVGYVNNYLSLLENPKKYLKIQKLK